MDVERFIVPRKPVPARKSHIEDGYTKETAFAYSYGIETVDQKTVEKNLPNSCITQHPVPNWKPWALHTITLLIVLCLQCGHLAICIYILRRYKKNKYDQIFQIKGNNTPAFVLWQFVSFTITVILGTFWAHIDGEVRRIEPFQKLSRQKGAIGKESLTCELQYCILLQAPYEAIKLRQLAPTLSSSVAVLAGLVIPTMSASMWKINWYDPIYTKKKYGVLVVRATWVYATSFMVALLAILVVILIVTLILRRSGMYYEHDSLAGLSALIYDSDILTVFCNSTKTVQEIQNIEETIKYRRFWLAHYTEQTSKGPVLSYKLVAEMQPADQQPMITEDELKRPPVKFKDSVTERYKSHPWPLWGRASFLVVIAGLIPNIVLYVSYQTFPDFSPFWIKFLNTLLALITSIFINGVYNALCIMEIFFRISPPKASDGTQTNNRQLMVNYNALTLPSVMFNGIRFGSPLIFLAAWRVIEAAAVSIISPSTFELLWEVVVEIKRLNTGKQRYTASGKPYFTKRPWIPAVLEDFVWKLFYVSIGLIVFSFIGWLGVVISRHKSIMPKKAESLAVRIAYLCHSKNLHQAVRGESMGGRNNLERKLKQQNKKYAFGWFKWDIGNGETRIVLGVEEHQRITPYTYGDSILRTKTPGRTEALT